MITIEKQAASEIALSGMLYDKAHQAGMTLSAILEQINPTSPKEFADTGLDAFGRQLQRCRIVLKNDPANGIYASQGKLFFQSNVPESRILFPEYINRRINAALIARGDFLDQYIVSEWQYAQVPAFRSLYLDDTALGRKLGRRAEGAAPRIFKASWSEKHVHTEDLALEVDMSYEFIQEVSLNILDVLLTRVAMQRSLDELAEAVYVIKNGDGSGKESSGAYVDNLSDMGVTTPEGMESLQFKPYIKWQSQFYPYKMTAAIGAIEDLVDFYTMTTPTDTTYALMNTFIEASAVGGKPVFADSPFGPVVLVPFADSDILDADSILGIDKTFGIIGHRDTAIPLTETDRMIREKWQIFVISNKLGFSNLFRLATRELNGDA